MGIDEREVLLSSKIRASSTPCLLLFGTSVCVCIPEFVSCRLVQHKSSFQSPIYILKPSWHLLLVWVASCYYCLACWVLILGEFMPIPTIDRDAKQFLFLVGKCRHVPRLPQGAPRLFDSLSHKTESKH